MLGRRLLTALTGIPIIVVGVWLGGEVLLVLVAALIVLGLWEFYTLADLAGYAPSRAVGVVAGVALAVLAYLGDRRGVLAVLAAVVLYVLSTQLSPNRGRALANAAGTILGVLYVGYFATHLLLLRQLRQGMAFTFLVFGTVWATDAAAYFVGRRLGRRKLLPQVSPNKTVEGATAGVVCGVLGALAVGLGFGIPPGMAAVAGALCSTAAVAGDLWESALKREARVKDSGTILPGHGGFLDRFDGVLFAAVVGYYVFATWTGAL
jgi:phosphatidate cytidylyltransferase